MADVLTGAHSLKMQSMLWIDEILPIRLLDLTGHPCSPCKSFWLEMRSVAPVLRNLHPDNHPHTAGHWTGSHCFWCPASPRNNRLTLPWLCKPFAKRLKLAGQTKGRLSSVAHFNLFSLSQFLSPSLHSFFYIFLSHLNDCIHSYQLCYACVVWIKTGKQVLNDWVIGLHDFGKKM